MHNMKNFNPTTIEQDQLNRYRLPYKGSDIFDWIKDNLNNDNHSISRIARQLNNNYLVNREVSKRPTYKAYYYIELNNSNYPILKRDNILSPVVKKDSKDINFSTIQDLIDIIDCYNYSIKFNPKLNDEDKEELANIYRVFEYRISQVLSKDERELQYFTRYSIYKKYQIYNIYKELYLDLSTLDSNIF